MMKIPRWNAYFFVALLLIVGYATFLVLEPFLTAMLVAAVLAVLFSGLYRKFLVLTRQRPALSAALTLLVVAALIVIPLTMLFSIAAAELSRVYGEILSGSSLWKPLDDVLLSMNHNPWLSWLTESSQSQTIRDFLSPQSISTVVREVSGSFLIFLQILYQNIAHFVFWMFTMFFALFYFLTDGDKAIRFLVRLSPLRDEHERLLIKEFVSMSRATIKGTIVLALIQGFLGGFVFAVAGINSPATWGIVMAFLALIPLLGTGLIWFPAGLVMLALGNTWQGVFILVFGFGVISTIDNLLRPKLVGKDTQIHPLLVFFATLGGLSLFGLVGFLIGPIIIALFMSLVKIYSIEFKSQLEEFNR